MPIFPPSPIPFWDPVPSGYEGELYASNPWDLLYMAGEKVPGISEVNIGPRRKFDTKDESGSNGSNPTFHGYQVDDSISIDVTIWTPQQLDAFMVVFRKFWPAAKKQKPSPIDVYHPIFAAASIRSIILTSIPSPFRVGKFPGSRVTTFRALEFLPSTASAARKSATITPVASKATAFDEPGSVIGPISGGFSIGTSVPSINYSEVNYSVDNAVQSLPSTDVNFTAP